ncbi:pleckstrin homology domain-containing family B member 2 [Trichomycterus rosablanca]|uniref:pleckstrin homology domain-containing family B member 2 n=1 Tax=Trichomycterus rosablanca TaxID=2290929 RepID=UPI002F35CEFE
MALVKNGWLYRQSTILRRWKRNWFDLWSDGRLIFSADELSRYMEGDIHMKVDCINIRTANTCQDLNPPEGKCKDGIFQIVCRNGRVISLCADSTDSALAWTMSLQAARMNTVMNPPQNGISSNDVLPSAPPLDVELNPTPQVYYPDQYGDYVSTPPSPNNTHVMYPVFWQRQAHASPSQYQESNPEHHVTHAVTEGRHHGAAGEKVLLVMSGAATAVTIGSFLSSVF